MNNKIAVITGAASGIGLALAKACILDGMHVVMVDMNASALDLQVTQLGDLATGMVCDVTNQEQVKQLAKQTYERFDHVDLLINNAGISGTLAPVWELSSEQVQRVIDVNMYGVLNCVQAFLPLMFEQAHASQLVNMASVYGLCSGSQLAPYAMSKHAIVALSESLYFDLRRLQKPVDISVVCPSFINTNLLLNSAPLNGSGIHDKVSELMTRCRSPEDVATHVMRELKNKTFYILPDPDVKHYYEQCSKAVLEQTMPYEHTLEKIMASLSR